jgi:hypothetical protein
VSQGDSALPDGDTSACDRYGSSATDVPLQMRFSFGAVAYALRVRPFVPDGDMIEVDSPRMEASPPFAEAARR